MKRFRVTFITDKGVLGRKIYRAVNQGDLILSLSYYLPFAEIISIEEIPYEKMQPSPSQRTQLF